MVEAVHRLVLRSFSGVCEPGQPCKPWQELLGRLLRGLSLGRQDVATLAMSGHGVMECGRNLHNSALWRCCAAPYCASSCTCTATAVVLQILDQPCQAQVADPLTTVHHQARCRAQP